MEEHILACMSGFDQPSKAKLLLFLPPFLRMTYVSSLLGPRGYFCP